MPSCTPNATHYATKLGLRAELERLADLESKARLFESEMNRVYQAGVAADADFKAMIEDFRVAEREAAAQVLHLRYECEALRSELADLQDRRGEDGRGT